MQKCCPTVVYLTQHKILKWLSSLQKSMTTDIPQAQGWRGGMVGREDPKAHGD